MSISRSPPPSGTTSMPSSRAAWMIHCRCSRRGCMYDFTEKAPSAFSRRTCLRASSRLSMTARPELSAP